MEWIGFGMKSVLGIHVCSMHDGPIADDKVERSLEEDTVEQ